MLISHASAAQVLYRSRFESIVSRAVNVTILPFKMYGINILFANCGVDASPIDLILYFC